MMSTVRAACLILAIGSFCISDAIDTKRSDSSQHLRRKSSHTTRHRMKRGTSKDPEDFYKMHDEPNYPQTKFSQDTDDHGDHDEHAVYLMHDQDPNGFSEEKDPSMAIAENEFDDDDDDASGFDFDPNDPVQVAERRQARATKESELRAAVSRADSALLRNLKTQEQYKAEYKDLQIPKESVIIDHNIREVANETQSPALANMLGDMWKELRMFAAPEQLEYLEGELQKLEAETPKLETTLEQAKANLTAQQEIWSQEDVAMQELTAPQNDIIGPGPAPAMEPLMITTAEPELAKPKPKFTTESMPEISAATFCIINLTWMYFLCYTALAVVRSFNQSHHKAYLSLQKTIESMCGTIAYSPMLCVLFLAVRMRAIYITQGDTDKYELPQPWVQATMYTCVFALLAQVVLVCLIGLLSPKITMESNLGGDIVDTTGNAPKTGHEGAVRMLTMIGYLVMFVLNVGIFSIIYGSLTMPVPQGLFPGGEPPKTPTLWCTELLAITFFAVSFGHSITAMLKTTSGSRFEKLEHVFASAKNVVLLAPMLCILFYAARMRAMQIFPTEGGMQRWAQRMQYLSSIALVVKAVFTIIIPMSDNGARFRGTSAGEALYVLSSQSLKIVSNVLRYCCLLCVYIGTFSVLVSIYLIKSPEGPAATPPISETVSCIVVLQGIYFAVYLSVFVIHSVREFLPKKTPVHRLTGVFEAGRDVVMFAPMCCLLMIACRMRALQITRNADGTSPTNVGPQAWVQEAMHVATWCIIISLVATYVSVLNLGTGTNLPDEQPKPVAGMHTILMICDLVNWISLGLLYGCVVAVVYGVYGMTPESLAPAA